jgi:hypothetical protein
MSDSAVVGAWVLADENGTRFAFTPEELAQARDDASGRSVHAERIAVSPALAVQRDSRW